MEVIYKLKCPEGKYYVGRTVNFQKRLKGHARKTSNCRKIRDAIHLHGIDNFEKDILWEGQKDEAAKMETYYIAHFDCVHPNGYNLNSGGGRGGNLSEETKRVISTVAIARSIKERGVIGSVCETSQKSGKSWRFTGTFEGKKYSKSFRTREAAQKFQYEFAKDPQTIIDEVIKPKKNRSPGNGTVYKVGERWRGRLYSHGKYLVDRYFDSESEAWAALAARNNSRDNYNSTMRSTKRVLASKSKLKYITLYTEESEKCRVRIPIKNGTYKSLGTFYSIETALEAYNSVAQEYNLPRQRLLDPTPKEAV